VAVAGSFGYVADGSQGLRVIDVSTPEAPVEVGAVDTPGVAYGVAVAGGYAYVADGSQGLRVIDVNTPSVPVGIAFVDTPGVARAVAVVGGYAYVADGGGGLRVIDVSTPSAPVEVGFYDVFGALAGVAGGMLGVAISSGYVFSAGGDAGIYVFAECGGVVFLDGFESGDTSAWSATVP